MKYAQLKAFSLPTGDDPEADDATDRAQAQPAAACARAPAREPGSDDVVPGPATFRLAPRARPPAAAAAPWEDAPWPDDAQPAAPALPRREPPRARERTAPPAPARDPNRPHPNDCISEGKHRRLEAIIAAKAREYEWDPPQLRDYVHRLPRRSTASSTRPTSRGAGRLYQDVCEWVEELGAP